MARRTTVCDSDLPGRIAAILERRRSRLPSVLKEVERWGQLDQAVTRLDTAVEEIRKHQRTPDELRQGLSGFPTGDIRKDIAGTIESLRVLEARFGRGTINIGVSGRARVGKSTLLQSLSGLTDEQIPTGRGLPVTAVRSRIFHTMKRQRATLVLHTFATFREEVLRPCHDELGLSSVPMSPQEFQLWQYPESDSELASLHQDKHTNITHLRRLRDMQRAFSSYEPDLTGGERTVDVAALRQFVAYPTNEDMAAGKCPRRYLAVREVRIECQFPYLQVDHIGIIDLPGLGELAANAEDYHLSGLQNEVDTVLLVTRPVEGMAFWGRQDGATSNLLDKARGFIKNRRDFVFIVINSGSADAQLTASLRDDICRLANDGKDGQHFQVLEADAASQPSIYGNVLAPVLLHLAERLPVMDDEVLEGTRARYRAVTARIQSGLRDLEGALASVSCIGGVAEDLDDRTVELREDLAGNLAAMVSDLKKMARVGGESEDSEFLDAVDAAYEGISEWIKSGFGKEKTGWCADALRKMRVDKNSSRFAAQEFNRIRVEISGRYCKLDNYFESRVARLWDDVAIGISSKVGNLLESREGEDALRQLANCLTDASEPCTNLADAIHDILSLRLEYRTHLHPRVRSVLDELNLTVRDPETGDLKEQVVVEASESGAEELYRVVTQLAQQAAYDTKKALVLEGLTPALVLHAAAEQFEDSLIRSGNSEREFKRFARSYRDEIWPGVFQGLDESNARLAKVARTVRAVRDLTCEIEVFSG